MEIKRGNVYMANLTNEFKVGVQGGRKPVVVISNDVGNRYSPSVIVAVITSRCKHNIPTHTDVKLIKESTIMAEQIFTLNKKDLTNFICKLDENKMKEVDNCLKISLGL